QVLQILQRLGQTARPAAGAVARLIGSSDENSAQYTLGVLNAIGGPPKEAIPDLVAALRTSNQYVRSQITSMLQQAGANAKLAVPALKELAKSGPANARVQALQVLRSVSPGDFKEAVPAIAELIGGTDTSARLAALQLAAQAGPGAKAALPAIT